MMERLSEGNPVGGTAEADLIEAIGSIEPVATSDARQQRILAAVLARAQTRRRRVNGAIFLRPAIAGAVLVMAGAATAAATVGHGWVARGWHRLTAPPAAVAPAAPPPRVVHARPPAPAVAPPAAEPASEATAPAEGPLRPPVPRASARVSPARGEDPSALVAAVRALRSEHDAQRAAGLLDTYRRTYPHGALAEEALALQIEAAANMKSPRAAAYAEQYLRTYPNGRFRQSARQALAAQRD
ncbi:MAG TPA: hypothetical protein VHH90_04780 [Polyangia bacterium]|nr:hypothetical protein [Polyangia bacterium]